MLKTNEQLQNLTTSKGGKGRVVKLQPKSHLFLEGNSFSQTTVQSFGVVSPTEFRTTATVSFTGTIFALCKTRRESKTPLHISSIGIDNSIAAEQVQNMKGEYRIPTILKEL